MTPGTDAPTVSTDSTCSPSEVSASAIDSTSSLIGARSASQEWTSFIVVALSELLEEADVVGEHLADVVDRVALAGHAVDAEAEGEAAPLLRIEAAGAQDVGMDHPAAAELQPV